VDGQWNGYVEAIYSIFSLTPKDYNFSSTS
jgi:hypothetical protein